MGSPTGNGVVNVGGVFYTQTLDAATTSNTASTLVKRDANGQFSGRLDGIAGKADVITNARNFSISGGDITASAQSFDGSAAVTLSASLNSVPSLGAGTYGSTTAIPVIQVAANGRVMKCFRYWEYGKRKTQHNWQKISCCARFLEYMSTCDGDSADLGEPV